MMNTNLTRCALLAATTLPLAAQDPAMLRGMGWRTESIYTIGNPVNGFTPTGIPDGIAAFALGRGRVQVIVNSELNPGNGYAYKLANGTMLTGARMTEFVIERRYGRSQVRSARSAFDKIYDRNGVIVTDPKQVNETANNIDGLARLCSGRGVSRGEYGFVDNIFFGNEETGKPFHPHGGSVWVLDVRGRALWAAPALGRGAWENVTPIRTGHRNMVGLILGDDTAGAPLYLYLGQKNGVGDRSFLDRNGLKKGTLYAWKADNGNNTPQQFNGEGSTRTGTWVKVDVIDTSKAGQMGYDAKGYLDLDTLQNSAKALGAFQFSRPEDLHENPRNPNQVVFASTGRGALFPADNWGTLYIITNDLSGSTMKATLSIRHDADGLPVPDNGIRSPDNLTWADNGKIYVQEDRSTSPSSLFGAVSGRDASIWELDPMTGARNRIGEVNTTVLLPLGVSFPRRGQLGVWETSGIIDVTDLFPTRRGETLLLGAVQAHGVEDGPIGGNPKLDEGGQLFFLSNMGIDHSIRCEATSTSAVKVTFNVTNGKPNGMYAVALAAVNAGNAPNGWFFGIDATFAELGLLSNAPLVGMLDGNGDAEFSFALNGQCPIGLKLDAVALEIGSVSNPVSAGTAVTHDF